MSCKHDWHYQEVNQNYAPYMRKCIKCNLTQFKAHNFCFTKWFNKLEKETENNGR